MWKASTVVVVASLAHAAWSATWVVHIVAITIVVLVVVEEAVAASLVLI
jgi:hypothetical protein